MGKYIRYVRLPVSVRGVTIPDENGDYNIYINDRLSHKMQIDTYLYEITHVENEDFDIQVPISVIENRVKYGD